MTKKTETVITLQNDGMHSSRKYKELLKWIDDNPYKEAKIYHMVLTGSSDRDVYMETLKAICEKLRDNSMPCQWHRCFEDDQDKADGKGFHAHIFLMIETKDQFPCREFLNHRANSKILPITDKRKVKFFIAAPQSPIHRTKRGRKLRYASLGNPDKIADVKVWVSYLVKNRSKAGVKNVYGCSRDRSSGNK